MAFDQSDYDVRFEWGRGGVEALSPGAGATVIVDVLSFCTAVDVAVGRGACVLPCRWRDRRAAAFARERGALLAQHERCLDGGFSLSPTSLRGLPDGARIVLPSPNGSELSFRAQGFGPTFAACLRNRSAVAAAVLKGPVAVIAAGERWPDGTLRPAWEDLVGAGAVIDALPGRRSPEAQLAADAFAAARLDEQLPACASARELAELGFSRDVALAAELDASSNAPRLVEGAYVSA